MAKQRSKLKNKFFSAALFCDHSGFSRIYPHQLLLHAQPYNPEQVEFGAFQKLGDRTSRKQGAV